MGLDSRAPVGILPEVSGRLAETENEHGKEQGDQYLRKEESQVPWILSGQEWTWYLYPSTPKVSRQGKRKAETSYKAQTFCKTRCILPRRPYARGSRWLWIEV